MAVLSGLSLVLTVILTLLPAVWVGVHANFDLLGQWFSQEFTTQLGQNEIWFPNQSLRRWSLVLHHY